MLIKLIRFFSSIFGLIIHLLFSFKRENIVVSQGSIYNNRVIISQCGSKRKMRFNNLSSGIQSEIDLKRVDYPSLEYIQLMLISLIYYPYHLNNCNILIIGLGGGILPRSIRKLYPSCSITIIEIDPLVQEMAKKYFYFKEDLNMKVIISDGRTYLNNLSKSICYDLIFVDAYDSMNSFPSNMKSEEFLLLLKIHLNSNGGFIIFNLVCIYQSYLNIRKTISSVFGLNNLITFRSRDFLNIVTLVSYSIEHFPNINPNLNLIYQMKQNLSIDVFYLLKSKQDNCFNEDSEIEIYKDNMEPISNEENISLTQFIYHV